MFVRDIMTKCVVTIPGSTSIINARKIMDKHGLKRLPVVDDGKLVGMVTSRRLERAVPPDSSRSIWELSYSLGSLYRTRVRQIMETDLVTARPDMTVEEAVALAQSRKVGALLVVEDSQLLGIVTTNDFFYRIVNKVLGVNEPGQRIWVGGGGESKPLEDVISTVNKNGLNIVTLHIIAAPKAKKKDVVVHLTGDNIDKLMNDLRGKGYKVEDRKR